MDNAALVSITFDDGLRCQFVQALPTLNQQGFPATFFLAANPDPTHEPWYGHVNEWWKVDWRDEDIAALKSVIRHGHEIGSHSVTHNLTQMASQPDVEAGKSKALIKEWLGIDVSSFAYPYYRSHAYLEQAVRKAGYEQARGGGVSGSYGPRASFYHIPNDGSADMFNIDCRQISRNENVGTWIRPGCWHVLTFHGIGGSQDGWEPVSKEEFDAQMGELARHRDSGSVEVVTFKEGARRMRQYKQAG